MHVHCRFVYASKVYKNRWTKNNSVIFERKVLRKIFGSKERKIGPCWERRTGSELGDKCSVKTVISRGRIREFRKRKETECERPRQRWIDRVV